MRFLFAHLALILAIAVSGEAGAQSAGAPLELTPGAAAEPKPAVHGKIPSNWKIITNQLDLLTDETSRSAVTMPKSTPVIDGKSAPVALVLRCGGHRRGLPDPTVTVVFTSLTGVGYFKKFNARYRFDEGPVQSFTAESKVGKNHARAIPLSDFGNPSPGIEIAGANRLRVEFDFISAGVTYLDFNVSGATQAISALDCE